MANHFSIGISSHDIGTTFNKSLRLFNGAMRDSMEQQRHMSVILSIELSPMYNQCSNDAFLLHLRFCLYIPKYIFGISFDFSFDTTEISILLML